MRQLLRMSLCERKGAERFGAREGGRVGEGGRKPPPRTRPSIFLLYSIYIFS